MRDACSSPASRARSAPRLPRQAGFTLVEVMVAMVLLLVAVLGTIKMIDTGSAAQAASRGREGATNVARELLEDAHATVYAKIGTSAWLTPQMQALNGGSGTVTTPTASSLRTTVTRRGIAYTATVSWCSVDDSKDGYGPKSSSVTWCADSTTVGTEANPEDMKRVTAQVDYTRYGRTMTVKQTVTFAATGGMVAPTVTSLTPSNPALSGPDYKITDGTQASQVFRGISAGAADMKFSVNGVEVTSGVAPNGSGNWDFTWQLAGLTDGTYTIAAVAVDALGNRSAPYAIQVRLARGAPLTAQNVSGGYNYVNPPGPGGTGSLVVELEWDANPEGSVTGYQVLRGATSVCGGQTSLANSCIDTTPPTTGSTTYTVKTWYRDANDVQQFVSANYAVTAPVPPIATKYGIVNSTASMPAVCPTGSWYRDLVSNYPTSGGTTATFTGSSISGCAAQATQSFTINAGTVTASAWFTNTSSNKTCTPTNAFLYILNADGSLAANFNVGGTMPLSANINPNTATPVNRTFSGTNTIGRTVQVGQFLELIVNVNANSPGCQNVLLWYGSGTYQLTVQLPSITGGGTGLATPNPPTGLSVTANGDGTRTLNWTAPASGLTVDEYRIYRDGTAVANRVDTQGATGTSVSWTDTNTGGTSHTYRVTAASANLAESAFLGPVTG